MASKAEKIKSFYQDNGWRKTISEFKISPKNLSKIVKKGESAPASAPSDSAGSSEEKPKTKKKGKKKAKSKDKAAEAAVSNPGVKEIIAEISAGLEKLKTALAA